MALPFDEHFYLSRYPDVAQAVRDRVFASALDHYTRVGRLEGRLARAGEGEAAAASAALLAGPYAEGRAFASQLPERPGPAASETAADPLQQFFDARREGAGVWKWRQYFPVYHKHLARFRARTPHVLEIGIYSGGSLDMWRDYFGPGASIYGVDIEPACAAYEQPGTRVFVGDQSSRRFWAGVRASAPALDVVLDDGGHEYEQQRISLEELLPYLTPGGVYICEDVHGVDNRFAAYAAGLASCLNAGDVRNDYKSAERRLFAATSSLQRFVSGVSFYPQMVVFERNASPVLEFVAPKHGTRWQPFLT
jgi:hypothetical protein